MNGRDPRQRSIVWEWCDRPGLEHLLLEFGDDGSRADGIVVAGFEGALLRLRYTVECDAQWRFRRAAIEAESNGGSRRRRIIERSHNDEWTVDGAVRPDLAPCSDIDIMGTPFTNTMPIRRLALAPEEPVAVNVVYVRIPDLAISVAAQDYTRRGALFRYRSLGSGFTAELSVDADGIVIDYGTIWRRRGVRPPH